MRSNVLIQSVSLKEMGKQSEIHTQNKRPQKHRRQYRKCSGVPVFEHVVPSGWRRFRRPWNLPGEGRTLGSSLEVLWLGHTHLLVSLTPVRQLGLWVCGHTYPTMTDCIPSAKSAAINPSSPKLVLGGAFHHSNRNIMNAESVEANALPALGLLTPYCPKLALMEIFMGWKSGGKSELLRLLPCPGRHPHWHASGIRLEKDGRQEKPPAQETGEAPWTGDELTF